MNLKLHYNNAEHWGYYRTKCWGEQWCL